MFVPTNLAESRAGEGGTERGRDEAIRKTTFNLSL